MMTGKRKLSFPLSQGKRRSRQVRGAADKCGMQQTRGTHHKTGKLLTTKDERKNHPRSPSADRAKRARCAEACRSQRIRCWPSEDQKTKHKTILNSASLRHSNFLNRQRREKKQTCFTAVLMYSSSQRSPKFSRQSACVRSFQSFRID